MYNKEGTKQSPILIFFQAATFSPDYSTLDVLIELKSDKFRRRVLTIKQDGVEMDLFCDPAVDYVKHIQVQIE